jgi:hypothetical protein
MGDDRLFTDWYRRAGVFAQAVEEFVAVNGQVSRARSDPAGQRGPRIRCPADRRAGGEDRADRWC